MTLAQFLNQNSFVLIAGAFLGIAAIVLRVLHARHAFWLLWSVALIAAALTLLGGRTTPERTFASTDEIEQAISGGAPTLIEFFSNY